MSIQPMLLKEIDYTNDVFDRYPVEKYIYQEKFNGERALIHIKDGVVAAIRNRQDNPVKQRWPEIGDMKFPGISSAVLDCEVIVEKDGKSIFYDGVNQRRAVPSQERLKGFPVCAVVFDLLYIEGQPLVVRPYSERLAFLSSKFSGFQNNHFKVVQNIQNPKQYWTDKIVKENREGLVLKDPKAPYSCGQRMNCQLKLKYYKRNNVIVEALEKNPKGVKIIGTTADGIKGEIQWSSMGFENIKVGDSIEVEYLDVVNSKMVQPHKVKDSFINKH